VKVVHAVPGEGSRLPLPVLRGDPTEVPEEYTRLRSVRALPQAGAHDLIEGTEVEGHAALGNFEEFPSPGDRRPHYDRKPEVDC
jgi:hypothetical protein